MRFKINRGHDENDIPVFFLQWMVVGVLGLHSVVVPEAAVVEDSTVHDLVLIRSLGMEEEIVLG